MFDDMLRDKSILSTQLTSLDGRQSQEQRAHSIELMSREEFHKLFRDLEREMETKFTEITSLKDMTNRRFASVTTKYLLDTCPGSSGCIVVSLIVENIDAHMQYIMVPHSKGNGLSGKGVTFT